MEERREPQQHGGQGLTQPRLPSEVRAEANKPLYNKLIMMMGFTVTLFGMCGLIGNYAGIPWLGSLIPGSIPMALPTAYALVFLGLGINTILDSTPYKEKPNWLLLLRYAGWLVPVGIGLYWMRVYIASPRFNIIDFSTFGLYTVAFQTAFILILSGAALYIFMTRKHSEVAVAYFMGIPAFLILNYSLMSLIGYVYDTPLLYSYRVAPSTAIAALLISLALEIGPLPFKGVMLPLLSDIPKARALAILSVALGLGIVLFTLIGMALSLSAGRVSETSLLSPQMRALYTGGILGANFVCVVIKTIGLRASRFLNQSMFYAAQQERVTQSLAESETRFRIMADAAPNLVWTLNPNGSLAYMNKAGLELFGVTLEKLLKDNWPAYIHPDDLEKTSHLLFHIMETKGTFQADYRVKDANGNYRWLLSSASPSFLPSGELHGYVGSSVDITERKDLEETLLESEERFRNMAETAPVNIWLNDVQARVTYANKALREFLGRTDKEAFDWERLEYLHPDDVEPIKQIYFDAYENQKPFTFEARHRRWDGEYRWIMGSSSPRFNATGEFLGFIGSSIDITERRHAEEALRESQRQLSESNRDLEHFATIASHDLQAPLRKVRTFADMIYEQSKGKVDPGTLDLIDRIRRSMDSAQNLVQDLLALSRAAKDNHPFRKVELSKVIYRVLSNLEQEIREKRAKVTIDSSEVLMADERQLERLIQNLIGNALKYQRPGQEPEIHIQSTSFDDTVCQIEIRDNGIGIPPEQYERIFEPFERLHGKSSQYEGTGVGLAICKRILERHAGTITVESELGKGSRFIVRLPYEPHEASHLEPVASHSEQVRY